MSIQKKDTASSFRKSLKALSFDYFAVGKYGKNSLLSTSARAVSPYTHIEHTRHFAWCAQSFGTNLRSIKPIPQRVCEFECAAQSETMAKFACSQRGPKA
jgi:hypothetical protein